jgi:hypothetical protein
MGTPQKRLATMICQSAWTALTNYNNGLDYYGKPPRFVPILSLDTWLKALEGPDGSLAALEDIESTANAYFASGRDQKDRVRDLQAAAEKTDDALSLLTARKSKIKTDLGDTLKEINKFDSDQQKSAKNDLYPALKGLEDQVKEAFGLNVDTFFNCLFQLSFTNLHEPINAFTLGKNLTGAMSLVQAGTMAVSQLGLMVHEATSNVLTKSGEPVKRELILDQIEVLKKDADLRSEFKRLADGILSHEGSDRLLVELDRFPAAAPCAPSASHRFRAAASRSPA